MENLDSRTPKFWTWLICILFSSVIFSAALITNKLRESQFLSQLESVHQKNLRAVARVQVELQQQALLTANLIQQNQAVNQLLVDAAAIHSAPDAPAQLAVIRENLYQLMQPYWQYLQPQGVKQLHFHLAPTATTLLRVHKPEMHSDVLAELRPLVMYVLKSGQQQVAMEVGKHGVGLRAVTPVFVNDQVIGAIEVGYGLSGSFTAETANSSGDSLVSDGMSLIINKKQVGSIAQNLPATSKGSHEAKWLTEDIVLNQTRLLAQIPEDVRENQFLQLMHEDKTLLVTLTPWPQFEQQQTAATVVLMSWQDVSLLYQNKSYNDFVSYLIWLAALLGGVASVYFISQKLQKSTATAIKNKQQDLVWSQQKLNALFELSPIAIALNRLDDGKYLATNPAMSELTGYSLEQLQQLSYWQLTPETYAEQERAQLQQLQETGRYGPYRKHYRHQNGELVDIELRGVKFVSPSGEEMIWSMISDLRETLKVEKLKQDFISTVSHELRTPLTSVNGSLDLLLGGAAGELPFKAIKLLGIAAKNNKRLIALVNDLLDIEKLSQGKLLFKPQLINSRVLLQNAVEHNLPFAQLHKVNLKLGHVDDVTLSVDPDRIQQVLSNLVSNAAKFSPENSNVIIHTKLLPQWLKIIVTDQGRGLTAEQISKLFHRFVQLENSTHKEQAGSGLGLAISREIMLQSDGKIGVESELGAGSSFWIELPLLERQQEDLQQKMVLVIEDDVDTAYTLKELLSVNGYQADIAHHLDQAWLLLKQRHYDLITLDLNLHDESGAEFFLKLRDTDDYKHMPVLVISAYIQQGKLQLQAMAHTLDWLEKPVNSDVLSSKIEQLILRQNKQLSAARILHVEDDDDIVAIMQMQLESKFHYHHAGSLADARAKIRTNRYDLILLDIGLPDGNGWQFIPDLQLTHAKVPVIIFSAQDVSVNQRNQATAVFGKTKIDPASLVEQISHLLNVH